MKSLLKVMLILAAVFATTFIIARSTGVLTVENIKAWLTAAQGWSPVYVATIVIALLFADLFIAVPTLTIMLLAGFFLGHATGFGAVITGLLMAGCGGYIISHFLGDRILNLIIKDEAQRQDAVNTFNEHGVVMILLSRAMPILPEVTACMSGITRMPFFKFLAAWLVSTVPYAAIATYAGSISSVDNPKPAILTAIGLTVFFWTGWFLFNRRQKKTASLST